MKERLPGMIDVHVHLRDFKESHKEDWRTGTSAALAGGVIGVLDMPNNSPPIIDSLSLAAKRKIAEETALCDFGVYLGATSENFSHPPELESAVFGLKMYLNVTHGPLLLESGEARRRHFKNWTGKKPILVHAEGVTIKEILSLVRENPRPVHFCHISQRMEIEWIREAKEMGLPVTCEVTPHHLFLTRDDEATLGPFAKMKPPLGKPSDVDALWQNLNLGVVDVVASDHAPHTREEKQSVNPPFGVPGLETTLPLLLTAVSRGKLTLEKVVELTSTNPARIFKIKVPPNFVEVDIGSWSVIDNSKLFTKAGWSPFAGALVVGKIKKVVLRGKTVFEDGQILVDPGYGRDLINES